VLNSDAFGDVAKMMQDRGYTFISIDEALKDPAYARPDTLSGRVGVTWLSRWAAEMGKNTIRYPKSPVPQFVLDMAKKTTFNHEKAKFISLKAIPFPVAVVDKPLEIKVLSDNSLVMTAGPKTDLHNPANGSAFNNNVPKLLFTPDKDFDFSAKIKTDFTARYDGGAILIYSDSENWAKILMQNTGSQLILGNSVVKNKITDDSYFNIPQKKEVYLRLRKNGRVFTFMTSQDGKQWDTVRDFVYSNTENMKIGFYSQSPVGTECKVEYSEITYSGKN
jgi:regulation of enolase protein 1 (concanavalin A-like superfamily)